MITAAVLTLALAQCGPPYNRTKVDDNDPMSHALYWREGTQIIWHLNDKGNPEDMGTEFAAAQKAFGSWKTQLESCASIALHEGPRTANRRQEYDPAIINENVVVWRFEKCTDTVAVNDPCHKAENCGTKYDCWYHNAGALAITTTSFDPRTGRILDADIELNTPGFIFSTVDSPVCVKPNYAVTCVASDVQNTLTHEVGHMLGLAHNCDQGSTMFASANPGETSKRNLDDGSKRFVCDVYPNDGGPSNSGTFLFAVEDCYPDGGGPREADGGTGCRGPATLGKEGKSGCAVAPGGLWAAAALGLLLRRRRR